jgi:hypothetical protein
MFGRRFGIILFARGSLAPRSQGGDVIPYDWVIARVDRQAHTNLTLDHAPPTVDDVVFLSKVVLVVTLL